MPSEVRNIKRTTERELWARAAGRCQFNGCNRLLYKSPVTQESVNISEKAHIYSFSENGTRGWGPFRSRKNREGINDLKNLMLVCHDCHKQIDKEQDGGKYPAPLLISWKEEHEKRITIVTGVDPSKKSTVVLYGANIGEETSNLQPEPAKAAIFPQWYPAEEHPLELNMTWESRDEEQDYWLTEEGNLIRNFDRKIRPLIEEGHHFSIFGLAPVPLLIRLGTLFTDKVPAQLYQLQREPEQTWRWDEESRHTSYLIRQPDSYDNPPVLIISLSATIARERILAVLGPNVSIWELAIERPHNDFLKTTGQLSEFRTACRKLLVLIAQEHGNDTPLTIFPAMPLACAVDFGRIRMPKSEMPWVIYDQNNNASEFIKALEIGVQTND